MSKIAYKPLYAFTYRPQTHLLLSSSVSSYDVCMAKKAGVYVPLT